MDGAGSKQAVPGRLRATHSLLPLLYGAPDSSLPGGHGEREEHPRDTDHLDRPSRGGERRRDPAGSAALRTPRLVFYLLHRVPPVEKERPDSATVLKVSCLRPEPPDLVVKVSRSPAGCQRHCRSCGRRQELICCWRRGMRLGRAASPAREGSLPVSPPRPTSP
jgi:hypothetical protein